MLVFSYVFSAFCQLLKDTERAHVAHKGKEEEKEKRDYLIYEEIMHFLKNKLEKLQGKMSWELS